MLRNEYLVVKIGVNTAENEPLKVLTSVFNIFHSGPDRRASSQDDSAEESSEGAAGC